MNFNAENPAKVGLIGCGNIAERYVRGIRRFPELHLVGCADLVTERAIELAGSTGITAYPSIEALLADPEIDIAVNITPPIAHSSVTIDALNAGKHVYVEKPLAAELTQTPAMMEAAKRAGRLLGAAPDTFLGSAGQTARAAIDSRLIGEPVAASMFVTHSKAELWHPDPSFLFQPGGGPALDMGPYYVTTLVNMLGPVAQVFGMTRIGAPVRTVVSPGRRVDQVEVTTPTHASAVLRLASGVLVTAMMSFDVWDSTLPALEIYGQEGTLAVPDPNRFDGDVTLHRHEDKGWTVVPPVTAVSGDAADNSIQMLRGYGVADLVSALNGGPHRASAALAEHVLEVLAAVETSHRTGTVVDIVSRVERPATREPKEQA